ncbi:MAG: MFS transporter [Burkholderiaceae bacterium]
MTEGATGREPRRGAGPWTVLAVTLAIQSLVSMAALAVPAIAPAVAVRLGISASLVGGYVTALYLGATLASMAAGPMVLRFGALRMSQCGLVACALGMALMALVPSVPAAVVAAVLTGLGYGPITPASSHLLARSTPPQRAALVFSIKQTGVPLGGVLAGMLVPPVTVGAGVAVALWAVCAGCIACAAAAQMMRRDLDADRRPGHAIGLAGLGGPLKLVAGHAELRRLAAVSFVFSAVQMCLAAYIVTYLTSMLGWSLVAAGAALSTAQIGGVVGRVAWGWLADRWAQPIRVLALLALLMAASTTATAALTSGVAPALVLALLALFGASATGWNGVYLAEVARRAPPGMAGSATGGTLAVTFFGVVLGPALFGVASSVGGGYRTGYALLAPAALLCAWTLLRVPRGGPARG